MRTGTATKRAGPPRKAPNANENLIAAVPQLEIAVTRSYQRRKHFLIATTNAPCDRPSELHLDGRSLASRCLPSERVRFAPAASVRLAEPAKINRHTELVGSFVSHSKQRAAPPINRHIFDLFWTRPSLKTTIRHASPIVKRAAFAPLLAAAILCGSAVAAQSLPPSATAPNPSEIEQARSLAQAGNVTEADKKIRHYLKTNPASAEAHFVLGYVLFREIQSHGTDESTLSYAATGPELQFREEKARESLAEFTEGARFHAPSAADLNVVAFDYVLLADYPDADKWMSRSVSWNPKDSNAQYTLGRIKYAENRFEEAIAAFQQCLSLDPKNVKAEDNLGLSYEGLGHVDEAIASYKTAIDWQSQAAQKDDGPYINLGSLLLDQDRAEEALAYLKQAVAMAPQDAKAHERLGKAYSHLNDLTHAQTELEKAASLAPDVASLHFMLGQVYRKEGLMDKAKIEFQRTDELNGTHSSDKAPKP
jgi:tetratricopeptide (TPR) repeat protein